jgi:hypothetical protein
MMSCALYEPDGKLLTSGTCSLDDAVEAHELRIRDLGAPGRLIQRCLTGPVHRVWLHLRDGRLASAEVARLPFDPVTGRSCVLRVAGPAVTHEPRRPIDS